MGLSKSKSANLSDIRFNSDQTSILCYNEDGLRVYKVSPLLMEIHQIIRFDRDDFADICGRMQICFWEMVYGSSTKLVVVTGTDGSNPRFKQNVAVYNETTQDIQFEVDISKVVISAKCYKNTLIVVCAKSTIIVWCDPRSGEYGHKHEIKTRTNPKGLCELSVRNQLLLVCMGRRDSPKGSVQLLRLSATSTTEKEIEPSDPESIQAHESEIACMTLDQFGFRLATASEKGTLIRIWDTSTGEKLHELRCSSEQVTINCIVFNLNSTLLCCLSNKRTGHIFSLIDSVQNTRSVFAGTSPIMGEYGESQQCAFAKFTTKSEAESVCAFLSDKYVLVASKDGSYQKFKINAESGDCAQDDYDFNFFADHDITWF